MGPPEKKPPFPMLDVYENEYITVEPGIERCCVNECNWLQLHENGMDPVHTAYLHVLTTGAQRGFSDAMGIVPIMQWVQNESGLHYIACRRVGDDDLVWVRVLDSLLPNFGLIPPSNDIQRDGLSQRPYCVTWNVPIDDYSTKRMYLMLNDRRNPLKPGQYARAFGQANDRPYADAQRHPGDYEMMTSQGPIAIHGYEHLTATDYGVIALRNLVRESIRAVEEGRDPVGIVRDENYRMRTRTQNTFVRAPRAATPEADVQVLKETGRRVAESDLLATLPPN
jgi:hypothetical protein